MPQQTGNKGHRQPTSTATSPFTAHHDDCLDFLVFRTKTRIGPRLSAIAGSSGTTTEIRLSYTSTLGAECLPWLDRKAPFPCDRPRYRSQMSLHQWTSITYLRNCSWCSVCCHCRPSGHTAMDTCCVNMSIFQVYTRRLPTFPDWSFHVLFTFYGLRC